MPKANMVMLPLQLTRAIDLDPFYKGDKDKAKEDFKNKKLTAKGEEVKDIGDYIEILRY